MKQKDPLIMRCWYCHAQCQHFLMFPCAITRSGCIKDGTYKNPQDYTEDGRQVFVPTFRQHAIYACAVCARETYLLFEERTAPVPIGGGSQVDGTFRAPPDIKPGQRLVFQYPYPDTEACHPSVPKKVADSFNEAEVCCSARAFHACAVMCGRTLEDLFDDQFPGVIEEKDTLGAILAKLKKSDKIRGPLMEKAEQIKLIRNAGAHQWHDQILEEDARDLLCVLREVVHQVYVEPAEAEKRLGNLSKIK